VVDLERRCPIEQMRSLVDPESLYSRIRNQMTPSKEDFEKIPK
jgi:hypothetical protein